MILLSYHLLYYIYSLMSNSLSKITVFPQITRKIKKKAVLSFFITDTDFNSKINNFLQKKP